MSLYGISREARVLPCPSRGDRRYPPASRRSLTRLPIRRSSTGTSTSSTHVRGEAKALVQLAEGLSVSWGHVFAVELNASRAARIAEAYPEIRLLGPCSFEATRITRHSFSLVYLNPPFDDELNGQGREETNFLRQAIDLLVPGGILVLVCPVNQVYGKGRMCDFSTLGSTSSSSSSSRMTAGSTTSASCSADVARRLLRTS